MGNQNPYDNYSPNPDWQNKQQQEGQIPPTQVPGPGYTPPSYPATKYDDPGSYLPPTQSDQPPVYPPLPTQYEQPAAYPPPPPQYQPSQAYPLPPRYQQQGYAPQNVYTPYGVPAGAPPDRGGGFAIAGLVLGIISLVAGLVPICGFPVAIVGIVMAALGRRSLSKRTMATIGLVLCIIGIVIAILSAIYGYNYGLQHYQ